MSSVPQPPSLAKPSSEYITRRDSAAKAVAERELTDAQGGFFSKAEPERLRKAIGAAKQAKVSEEAIAAAEAKLRQVQEQMRRASVREEEEKVTRAKLEEIVRREEEEQAARDAILRAEAAANERDAAERAAKAAQAEAIASAARDPEGTRRALERALVDAQGGFFSKADPEKLRVAVAAAKQAKVNVSIEAVAAAEAKLREVEEKARRVSVWEEKEKARLAALAEVARREDAEREVQAAALLAQAEAIEREAEAKRAKAAKEWAEVEAASRAAAEAEEKAAKAKAQAEANAQKKAAAEAAIAVKAGLEANQEGEYEEARERFVEAYGKQRRASTLVSAANMALKLGDAKTAALEYEQALRSGELTQHAYEVAEKKLGEAQMALPAVERSPGYFDAMGYRSGQHKVLAAVQKPPTSVVDEVVNGLVGLFKAPSPSSSSSSLSLNRPSLNGAQLQSWQRQALADRPEESGLFASLRGKKPAEKGKKAPASAAVRAPDAHHPKHQTRRAKLWWRFRALLELVMIMTLYLLLLAALVTVVAQACHVIVLSRGDACLGLAATRDKVAVTSETLSPLAAPFAPLSHPAIRSVGGAVLFLPVEALSLLARKLLRARHANAAIARLNAVSDALSQAPSFVVQTVMYPVTHLDEMCAARAAASSGRRR